MAYASEQDICAPLSMYPVLKEPEQWLKTAAELISGCHYKRAKLVLETVLQAHQENVEAHLLLVDTCLHLGSARWPEGLRVARSARGLVGSVDMTPVQQLECYIALAVGLGAMARTPVMAQSDRSEYRYEARQVLEDVLQQAEGKLFPRALYLKALMNAEGGHYDQAVADARSALAAAEGQPGSHSPPAVLALLALLLSARQQLQAAIQVADAGLALCYKKAAAASSSSGAKHLTRSDGGPCCLDTLLLRIKAQLLLAMGDANQALCVLGAAKKKLSAKRSGLGTLEGATAVADVFRQQEAQVWRELAVVYASQAQPADAELCMQQAQLLEPRSAATFHAAGSVAEASGRISAAQEAYQTALSLDPGHAPSLHSFGTLLRKQGTAPDLAAASSSLTDALRYQPHNHVGWYNLGLVRKAQGLQAEAEKHLFTAVKLAAAAPVLSYSEMPLLL